MAIKGTINVSPKPTQAFNPAPFLDPINQGLQNVAKLRMKDMERKIMEQSLIARENRAEQRAKAASSRAHANSKDLIDFKKQRLDEAKLGDSRGNLAALMEENPGLAQDLFLLDPTNNFDINGLDQFEVDGITSRFNDSLSNRNKFRDLQQKRVALGLPADERFTPSWAMTPNGLENMEGLDSPEVQIGNLQSGLTEALQTRTFEDESNKAALTELRGMGVPPEELQQLMALGPGAISKALEDKRTEAILDKELRTMLAQRDQTVPIGEDGLANLSLQQKISLLGAGGGPGQSFQDFTSMYEMPDGSLKPGAYPMGIEQDLERAAAGNFPGYRSLNQNANLYRLREKALSDAVYASSMRNRKERLRDAIIGMQGDSREEFGNAYRAAQEGLGMSPLGEDADYSSLLREESSDPVFSAMFDADGEPSHAKALYDLFEGPQQEFIREMYADSGTEYKRAKKDLMAVMSSPEFRRLSPSVQQTIKNSIYGGVGSAADPDF